jgi:hypothetical protein
MLGVYALPPPNAKTLRYSKPWNNEQVVRWASSTDARSGREIPNVDDAVGRAIYLNESVLTGGRAEILWNNWMRFCRR